MQVHDFFENAVQNVPDKQAVWADGTWYTYREIYELSLKITAFLLDRGTRRGDKIAILFTNSLDYIAAYFGILRAGGVVVGLNTETNADALTYLLNHSEATTIFADGKFSKHLLPALRKTPDLRTAVIKTDTIDAYKEIGHCHSVELHDMYKSGTRAQPVRGIDLDLAEIVYTSGSTGEPKGVMLSHLNLVSNQRSIANYLGLTGEDRVMVILPFYYIYGKSLLLTHFLVQGSLVIDNRFLYPNTVLQTMAETEATGFAGVPSTFMILLNRSSIRDFSFPALRYVTQAGGAMAPAVQSEVIDVFDPAKVFIMYGATEAAPRLSYLDPELLSKKLGSIGKPVDNVDLHVLDSNGKEVPEGETGEIAARGSNIMVGYWKDPEGTDRVLKNGMYHTGDLGKVDEDGFFYVVGRIKDIIKVKGFRVSAKEIEEKILEMDEVHETAVIGVDDPVLGEAIKAFVVPRSDGDKDAEKILLFLREQLPAYKVPKEVVFRTSLPKNNSGKIMKTKLKEEEK